MNSNTIPSVEEIERTAQAWLNQEVLVSRARLYSAVSAVPSSTHIATDMGVLRFERGDSPGFRLMSEVGEEIAKIHNVYTVDAEDSRLFVDGWVGDPATQEWARWIIEK